jgi:hypothetical protein
MDAALPFAGDVRSAVVPSIKWVIIIVVVEVLIAAAVA